MPVQSRIQFAPTLDAAKERGLLIDIDTLWLDRGYDSKACRDDISARGITDTMIAKQRRNGEPKPTKTPMLGLRWPVERTNSWLSNFGQLHRNTDRRSVHRMTQLSLAVVCLLTAKLIDWRDRWSPSLSPVR